MIDLDAKRLGRLVRRVKGHLLIVAVVHDEQLGIDREAGGVALSVNDPRKEGIVVGHVGRFVVRKACPPLAGLVGKTRIGGVDRAAQPDT